MAVLSGIIKLFNDIHGNGIIEPDNGVEAMKFSYKDVIKQGFRLPNEGQRVDFEIVKTANGPRTRNIVLKNDA